MNLVKRVKIVKVDFNLTLRKLAKLMRIRRINAMRDRAD